MGKQYGWVCQSIHDGSRVYVPLNWSCRALNTHVLVVDETKVVMLHQLQEEERQEAGQNHVHLHDTGPAAFLGMALWIKDLQ